MRVARKSKPRPAEDSLLRRKAAAEFVGMHSRTFDNYQGRPEPVGTDDRGYRVWSAWRLWDWDHNERRGQDWRRGQGGSARPKAPARKTGRPRKYPEGSIRLTPTQIEFAAQVFADPAQGAQLHDTGSYLHVIDRAKAQQAIDDALCFVQGADRRTANQLARKLVK